MSTLGLAGGGLADGGLLSSTFVVWRDSSSFPLADVLDIEETSRDSAFLGLEWDVFSLSSSSDDSSEDDSKILNVLFV